MNRGGHGHAPVCPVVRLMLALIFALMPMASMRAAEGFFPIYSEAESTDGTEQDASVLWPLFSIRRTTDTLVVGLHPVWSWSRESSTGNRDFDLVWPFVQWRARAKTYTAEDWRSFKILPIFFDGRGRRGREEVWTRFLVPIYWSGRQGRVGRYWVLFPVIWYAREAKLAMPLFPPRRQTFAAIFPLYGDFRGYWNRQRVQFLLWPIYVRSRDGRGDQQDVMTSFVWPVLGLRTGPKTSGFRVWPLISRASREGQFNRWYFLWPLGHVRTGVIAKDNPSTQSLVLFVPLYANIQREQFRFHLLFPFYGVLEQKGRATRGWILALYNQDDNRRRGIRNHRLLWFIIRWTTRIPALASADPEAVSSAREGGGVFPIYLRTKSPVSRTRTIVWPLYTERWNAYKQFQFARVYLVPFYSYQGRFYPDGTKTTTEFIFPFLRRQHTARGVERYNNLHLFWYDRFKPLDRNYAPLWAFYDRREDIRTGARRLRIALNFFDHEVSADGTRRREWNVLGVHVGRLDSTTRADESHVSLFGGLYGRSRVGDEVRQRVLWIRIR